jgi:Major capsid protein N-terminus/Large eukaryotic DNA virus major capsid protein
MSGGVVQLVATGIQDAHLTGNPEISYFRSNYKRHTQFAMSNEHQILVGTPNANGTSTIRFEKKGDLLSYVYFTVRDQTGTLVSVNWGAVFDRIELLIGGQVIDMHDVFFSNTIAPMHISSTWSTRFNPSGTTLFFPLQFWFCKDFQSAIPLVALQYHDVELRITWSSALSLSNTPTAVYAGATAATTLEIRPWANYIFLDKDEREFFANKPQDNLIWQMQRIVSQGVSQQDVVFSHPVKFISWGCNVYSNFTQTLKLQVNGTDIGIDKSLIHYSQVAPYYHTQYGFDPQNWGASAGLNNLTVGLIPFCLDTSKLQPTGTLNFSRIDTCRMITHPLGTIRSNILDVGRSQYIYGVNYNVLRINQGMAGLLYSS